MESRTLRGRTFGIINRVMDRHADDYGDTLPGIVIPAYQPDEVLIELVNQLLQYPYPFIIIVNDGSSPDSQLVFDALRKKPHTYVVTHAVNLGKGAALKTAFNHVLVYFPEACGVVTIDADGQHLPEDVFLVTKSLAAHPHQISLGVRSFENKVPLRSRFGNSVTKWIFNLLIGHKLQDTQTGLRGIPAPFMKELLLLKTGGYEFELEMLILGSQKSISYRQILINTIYKDNNRGSHFNPLVDSLKIYFVFLRFLMNSLISATIDIAAFVVAYQLEAGMWYSTVIGRLAGGGFNFLVNKIIVFKSHKTYWIELIKYISLLLVLMLISYILTIAIMDYMHLNVYIAKIVAHVILFLMSFATQRVLVFR